MQVDRVWSTYCQCVDMSKLFCGADIDLLPCIMVKVFLLQCFQREFIPPLLFVLIMSLFEIHAHLCIWV